MVNKRTCEFCGKVDPLAYLTNIGPICCKCYNSSVQRMYNNFNVSINETIDDVPNNKKPLIDNMKGV